MFFPTCIRADTCASRRISKMKNHSRMRVSMVTSSAIHAAPTGPSTPNNKPTKLMDTQLRHNSGLYNTGQIRSVEYLVHGFQIVGGSRLLDFFVVFRDNVEYQHIMTSYFVDTELNIHVLLFVNFFNCSSIIVQEWILGYL